MSDVLYILNSLCSLAEVCRSSLCFSFTVGRDSHPVEKSSLTVFKSFPLYIYIMSIQCSLAQCKYLFIISTIVSFSTPQSSLSSLSLLCLCICADFFKEADVAIWMFRRYKQCCNMEYILLYTVHCAILFWRTIQIK